MMVCSPISTCAKNVVHLRGHMGSSLCSVISCQPSSSCYYFSYSGHPKTKYTDLSVSYTTSGSPAVGYRAFQAGCFRSSRRSRKLQSLVVKESISDKTKQKRQLEISWPGQSMKMKFLLPKQGTLQKFKCTAGPISWSQEAAGAKEDKQDDCESSHAKFSHGKKVYTDYSVIGIPGDGRCMFRSVAHGACLRSGKSAPSEHVQRELADDLRAKVADEFIKRRKETEWMPITVYMYDKGAGGLIAIAEYGQEYGTENPIRVLYHGFGHYDALQMPGRRSGKSKL
ncbi:PREDICTED: OTU domain-containing protein At3g57810 isoform X4 [Theobroma cacao]|uniref:Ubiquitin thioesterase OTU n=1 Tax=Theobroma cacao TaxID=3641 RepID=A0AB32WF24_THECC|nr:PREDICTED: OTU domain-containing protein At3g57810 isoform X4 [Theobroma cacao]